MYSRASLLGFTREELDDILQTIQPEDMQGTSSAQEAADRLLSSVYMAVVSDVGEAEGLTPQQVGPTLFIRGEEERRGARAAQARRWWADALLLLADAQLSGIDLLLVEDREALRLLEGTCMADGNCKAQVHRGNDAKANG